MRPDLAGGKSDTTPAVFDVEPTSRPYLHDKCGGTTVVSDWAFKAVCHPSNSGVRTQCAACGRVAPLSQFRWADTGEPILDYHRRLRPHFPPGYAAAQLRTTLAFFAGLVVGGLGGAGLGVFLNFDDKAPLILAVAGALLLGLAAAVATPKGPKVDFRKYV